MATMTRGTSTGTIVEAPRFSSPFAAISRLYAALAERHRRSVERAELRAMDRSMWSDLGASRVFEEINKRDSQP